MKIFTVNFEQTLKNYIPYQNSIKEIEGENNKFNTKMLEISKEIETISNSHSRLLLDDSIKQQNFTRARELQSEGMRLNSEFRQMMAKRQNEVLENCLREISLIVNEWAEKNNADIVLNNNSIFYTRESLDVTNKIIDTLKDKDLYSEWIDEVVSE